ncbi:methyl-accepting chemotaxis protein [Conexibacter sp. SYSU D00693]|uniref:methyl-accepting chemotaxis protein n=1 Tax=Conexibacter sp. SYSU D00693 TaxID=2812560 RepID=UPI00196A3D70|nr:methyl-accepting chemotaxis protein [Conexibacter sp. SYSU D00693]
MAPAPAHRRLLDRFAVRLVLGMVLSFLPLAAVLSVLLVRNASDSLDEAARAGLRNAAVTLSQRIDVRFGERRNDLRAIADLLGRGEVREDRIPVDVRVDFEALQLVDLRGRYVGGTTREPLGGPADPFFAAAARGAETHSLTRRAQGTLRTVLAQPVRDRSGRIRRVLLGDLDETVFAGLVSSFRLGETGEAVIRVPGGRLLWRTGLGQPRSPVEMAARDPLADRSTTGAPGRALAGQTGTLRFRASTGNEAVGGYAPARRVGWSADVRQDTSEAFAAIDDQRNLAILVGLLGSLLVGAFAVLFARHTVRPVSALAEMARRVASGDLTAHVEPGGASELRQLGESFNAMVESLERLAGQLRAAGHDLASSAAQLSSSAQELATTTTQQSSSATETSSTMQELSTTTQSIADSVSGVEQRATDTRSALHAADTDIQASSERTLALAQRTAEIGQILGLINEIADRTNLLALNAAIEAARAGEAGAGFSVVADEVRRLAERSKAEAQKIADIVGATQDATNATVMAMDSGSKRMRDGLELMEQVADAVSQVRYTTDEQRLATEQVVQAMSSVTATSRQAAAAAQQIAGSSTQIARLAADLDRAAATFRTRAQARSDKHTPIVPAPLGPAGPPGANGAPGRAGVHADEA